MSEPAYQLNAYQKNAYQTAEVIVLPAFDGCAFQFNAFQAAPCPVPPEPLFDGHDGGRRKKALKKLQDLEDKRIAMIREDGERRKLAIRHALDPQAKMEYETRMAAQNAPVRDIPKEIAKIDSQIDRVANLKQNQLIQAYIKAELGKIQIQREIRNYEIQRQIQEADDELALLMFM